MPWIKPGTLPRPFVLPPYRGAQVTPDRWPRPPATVPGGQLLTAPGPVSIERLIPWWGAPASPLIDLTAVAPAVEAPVVTPAAEPPVIGAPPLVRRRRQATLLAG